MQFPCSSDVDDNIVMLPPVWRCSNKRQIDFITYKLTIVCCCFLFCYFVHVFFFLQIIRNCVYFKTVCMLSIVNKKSDEQQIEELVKTIFFYKILLKE